MTIIGFKNIDGSAMVTRLDSQIGMLKNLAYPRSWGIYHDNGWRFVMQGEPCPEGHVLDYSEIVWDGTNDQWQQVNHYITTAEAEARRAAAEAARQAAKPIALKQAENGFIMVCDAVRVAAGQSLTQTKLGTYELDVYLEQIKVAQFPAAVELALKASALNTEVLAQGGTWADINWHQEITE